MFQLVATITSNNKKNAVIEIKKNSKSIVDMPTLGAIYFH